MTQRVNFSPDPWPHCPDCGAKMVLRARRSDGKRFWGCFNFPECRGSRNILENGEPDMPETDQEFSREELERLGGQDW